MKSSTKYGGWVGVGVALLLSFAALCASLAFPKQVGSVWYVATYPVTKAWEAFFRTLEGDHAMMFILPMLATQLLFVLAVGFGVGAILSLVLGSRDAEPGASERRPGDAVRKFGSRGEAAIGELAVNLRARMRVFSFCLMLLGLVVWPGCATHKTTQESGEQVLYYDRNGDGKVDQEMHKYRGVADADWELRDDDHDGRYEKKVLYGFAVVESSVDLPVPTHVHIEPKP